MARDAMTELPPLVSTEWLAAHLGDPDLVILEASIFLDTKNASGRPEFRSGLGAFEADGRIPQSRFADLFFDYSDATAELPFTRPQQKQFVESATRSGIDATTTLVIYDRLVGQWAARLWWLFKTFGHQRVAVLDGGFKKWSAEGHQIETGQIWPHMPEKYQNFRDDLLLASKQDVEKIVLGEDRAALVCLLPEDDFTGAVSVRRRAGHIPGSVNLPFKTLLDPRTNALLPPDQLRAAFEAVVPLDGRKIVTYCGGGIASTLGALALSVIGYANAAEYDGSLAEWVEDTSLPMETGPAKPLR
jgi:thiosulfate/3-mercaptopyruvate sulfurtransferase